MTDGWVPFGLDAEEVAEYRVLVPGVPQWLREPLLAWVSARWINPDAGAGWLHAGIILTMQNTLRIDIGVKSGNSIVSANSVRERLRALPEMELLQIVDWVLSIGFRSISGAALTLDVILRQAQSAYSVGTRFDKIGLVDRVPEGVRSAVEGVINEGGSAGTLLARGWAHVHGLQKNDTAGYADAVRAVEIAAIAVVEPGNTEATLGSVITRMRALGDWRLPLREHAHAPSAEMIVQMLRTLYRGHRDRHGNLDYSDVTHEEARAGIVLAATLVDWFVSGAIARRPAEQDASS
ncbi:hypothetical protein [Cellulomonas flavigena]|nr:hypothetical protein [Cellulomonas flavigena]